MSTEGQRLYGRDDLVALLADFGAWLDGMIDDFGSIDEWDETARLYLESRDGAQLPAAAPRQTGVCAWCRTPFPPDARQYQALTAAGYVLLCVRCAFDLPGATPIDPANAHPVVRAAADDDDTELPF